MLSSQVMKVRKNTWTQRGRGCDEMIHVEDRWKVVFTHLDREGADQFPLDIFTKSFQWVDLAVSCGFIELCADCPTL